METGNTTQEMRASEGVLSASLSEGAPTLLIKTQDGLRRIFPWIHFINGDYENLNEIERITLHYSSHEVCMEGVRLEPLFERIAKFSVEWIKANDKRLMARCPQGSPFIEKISISEKNNIQPSSE